MADLWGDYGPATRRLVDAFFEGEEPAEADVRAVRAVLDADFRRVGFDLHLREDLLADTLLRVFAAVRAGRVTREANVAGYIRTVARHCALDAGRYRSRRPTLPLVGDWPEPRSDDQVASLIDALADAEEVRAALALAVEEGDVELAGFIAEWLVMAERTDGSPSLRDAAEALGTNHVRVQRDLERFGHYLRRARRSVA
jgi:DNA-directed RNA polymerase specialized sigma24 family protein